MTKRRITLNQDLKKGFDTVYDQCSQEVRDKLESSDRWETVQTDQSLHKLILKIEQICVGFDDQKQEVYNLVQAMKTLLLYTQTEKSQWKITPPTNPLRIPGGALKASAVTHRLVRLWE